MLELACSRVAFDVTAVWLFKFWRSQTGKRNRIMPPMTTRHCPTYSHLPNQMAGCVQLFSTKKTLRTCRLMFSLPRVCMSCWACLSWRGRAAAGGHIIFQGLFPSKSWYREQTMENVAEWTSCMFSTTTSALQNLLCSPLPRASWLKKVLTLQDGCL